MSDSNKVVVGAFGGRETPEQLLLELLQRAESMETVVVSFTSKGDDGISCINTWWSNGALTTRIGMLEVSKVRMIDSSEV